MKGRQFASGRAAGSVLYRCTGLFLFLLLWEAAPRLGLVRAIYLTPPTQVVATLVRIIINGELLPHVLISLKRIFLGLFFASTAGVILGLFIGYFRRVEQALDLLFQTLRQMSAFALFPVFILFFGLGEIPKVVIIFWASLWPVLLNTSSGVRDVDQVLIRSAKSMGATRKYIFLHIILPATTPQIFTGIRLGGSYCVMAVVAAEMIGATAGLGYLVLYSQQTFKVAQMYGSIIALAILGVGLNWALQSLEKFFSSWRQL